MSAHPLIEQSTDPAVRRAATFRKAAEALGGKQLQEFYEVVSKKQAAEDRQYHGSGDDSVGSTPRADRAEHLSKALVEHVRKTGQPLAPPDEFDYAFRALDCEVPLWWGPGKPVGKASLVGITEQGRLVIGGLKYQKPSASRGGTGESPLRALLEALSFAALIDADREEFDRQIQERFECTVKSEPPLVLVMANAPYWQLCRKREAQKGAAWICEVERIAREVEESFGVGIRYVSVNLTGDPGWTWKDGRPVFDEEPAIGPAWERTAGRVRVPTQRSSRGATVEIIEADPTRPVRTYAKADLFAIGDAIDHMTLGRGVVQRLLGPTKIEVRFDQKNRVLVHGRGT